LVRFAIGGSDPTSAAGSTETATEGPIDCTGTGAGAGADGGGGGSGGGGGGRFRFSLSFFSSFSFSSRARRRSSTATHRSGNSLVTMFISVVSKTTLRLL